MPYLGNIPAENYASFDKQTITGDGGTSYTLTHPVGSAQEVAIFVNNVRQEPGVAYTVTGTALTMTGNVESTDDFYAIFIGKAVQTVEIPEKATNGDYDFDNGTLFIDASTNRVGINTTSPGSALEVEDNTDIDMNSSGTGHLQVDGNAYQFAIALNSSAANLYTNSSSRGIVFGTNETERARITNSGLTFHGDTAAANALDDYEEGTFTPTLANDGSSTYAVRQGHYTKIGNVVTIQTKTTINTRSGGSGTTGILNLPYAMRSSSPSQQTFHLVGNNNWDTNYSDSNITGYASASGSTISFYYNSGLNLNGISIGDIGSSGEVYVSGSYLTD